MVAAVLQQPPRRGTGSLIIRGTAVDSSPEGAAPAADQRGGATSGPVQRADHTAMQPAVQQDEGPVEGAHGALSTVAEPLGESRRTAHAPDVATSDAATAQQCAAADTGARDPQEPGASAPEVSAGHLAAAESDPNAADDEASLPPADSQSAAALKNGGAGSGADMTGRPNGCSAKSEEKVLPGLHAMQHPGPDDDGSTPSETPALLTVPQHDSATAPGSDDIVSAAPAEFVSAAAAPEEETLTKTPSNDDAVLCTAAAQLDGARHTAESQPAADPEATVWAAASTAAGRFSGTPSAAELPKVAVDVGPPAPGGGPGRTAGGAEAEAHVPVDDVHVSADGAHVPAAGASTPAARHDQLPPPGAADAPVCGIEAYSPALDGDLDGDAAASGASESRGGDSAIGAVLTMPDVQPGPGATPPAAAETAALAIDGLLTAAPGSAAERDQSEALPADAMLAVPVVVISAGDLCCLSDYMSPPLCHQTSLQAGLQRYLNTSISS